MSWDSIFNWVRYGQYHIGQSRNHRLVLHQLTDTGLSGTFLHHTGLCQTPLSPDWPWKYWAKCSMKVDPNHALSSPSLPYKHPHELWLAFGGNIIGVFCIVGHTLWVVIWCHCTQWPGSMILCVDKVHSFPLAWISLFVLSLTEGHLGCGPMNQHTVSTWGGSLCVWVL